VPTAQVEGGIAIGFVVRRGGSTVRGGLLGPLLAAVAAIALLTPALARASAGDLDQSFGDGGIVLTYFGGADETAADSVAIDSHGRIVVGGFDGTGPALVRYRPNGDLDGAFGMGGVVTDDAHGTAVAIDSSDRILLAGDAISRYKPNGDLDPAFGGGGVVALPFDATVVAVDSLGRVVAGGLTDGAHPMFKLARYLSNGMPDSSFGAGGVLTTTGFVGRSMAVYPSGRIAVAGTTAAGVTVARYRPDGTPDPTFEGGTASLEDLGPDMAVAIGPSGQLAVAGTAVSGSNFDFGVAAFQAGGAVAGSFGDHGTVTTDVGGLGKDDYANAVAFDSQGRIVAGGYAHGNANADFALARYNPDGSLDRSFSGDGISITSIEEVSRPFVSSLAIDSHGRIVAAGGTNFTHNGGVYEFALGRYVGVAPPVVSITSGPSRQSPTSDPTPSFGFAADEFGSTYECSADGTPLVACSSPHPTRRLSDGVHTFAVRATDLDGLTGEATSRRFTVDTVAPTVVIRGPSRLKTRHRRVRASFRLRSSEQTSFKCKVDSHRFRRCSSPYRTPRLAIGRHRIRVHAADAAGNTGSDMKRLRIVEKR
jgi:uncharacterized delta-60 repeat protein